MARETVHRMNESLRHRGPDDEGIFVGSGIGLGHRRLSIIDVAGGHQPISNEDGTIWVMFNGEIYNYADLRQELLSRGHRFTTRSDTEAIVHLYEDYGEECFARLRGMFAIVIWDSNERRLLLARDRLGKKPLYYYADRNRIIFGSELKAILAADAIPRAVDPLAVSDYFSLSYIPAPRTIYKSVRKLQPAHYLVVSAAGLREAPYWRLSFANVQNHTEAEWCELIREQLCEFRLHRLERHQFRRDQAEQLGRFARHQHDARDVGGKDGVEAGAIHIDQFLEHADAGIINQDIQVTQLLLDFLKSPQDIGLIGDIRLYAYHAQRAGSFSQPFRVAPRDGDARARLCQYLGRGPADAA